MLNGDIQAARVMRREDYTHLACCRFHGRGELFGDQPARIPGEIAQERRGKQRKQKQIRERQPKRRGSDQLTECRHGSYIPRRGWYGAAADQNLYRSWNATAKYARR